MNRRDFLAAAAALPLASSAADGFFGDPVRSAGLRTPLLIAASEGPYGILEPQGELTLTATGGRFALPGGRSTPFLWYAARHEGREYANPIFRVRRGGRFAVTLDNALDEATNVHWHGLHVPGRMDGHPRDTIGAGARYRYEFTVDNRSGAYWYHPHAHGLTARQAYSGLASFFLVEDEDEWALRDALDLRPGETDLPVLIQDKRFGREGELVYAPSPMERVAGYLGDTVLANLTSAAFTPIGTRIHRLRLLNGSNARIFRLAFVMEGRLLPFQVIGTDGGLMEEPLEVTEAFLAPGERLDVLLDAGGLAVGDEILLRSLAFDPMDGAMMGGMMGGGMMGGGMMGGGMMGGGMMGGGMMGGGMMGGGMMGGGMMGARGPSGAGRRVDGPFDVLRLAVTERASGARGIPRRLSRMEPIAAAGAFVRPIRLEMGHMRGLIDGQSYREDAYPIQVRRGTIEVWELRNAASSMPHPMHLHGFAFQVLSRAGTPPQAGALARFGRGRVASDLGWKDTVLVWPGETVRIAIDFSHRFAGDQVYPFHCHNLEHEDGGMMVNVLVRG